MTRAGRLLVLLLSLLVPSFAASEPLTLERAVLVQRHGVRAPTASEAKLAGMITARAWPQWPVGPGKLTPHGAQVVALVGGAVGAYFSQQELLPAHGCPQEGAAVVWADGKDSRTRMSGTRLASSLAPGCGLKARHAKLQKGQADPVFDSLRGACRLDDAEARSAFDAALKARGGSLLDAQGIAALNTLEAILRPATSSTLSPSTPSEPRIASYSLKLKGPVGTGGAISEMFLLQYAQGMPLADVAFGQAGNAAAIERLMPLHRAAISVTRELPYLAQHRGAVMARLILDTLDGQPRHASPAIGKEVRLLALAGHDTNLSNMAGIFHLDWSLPLQPDPTAPATALVFELWRDRASGTAYVAARIWYAELDGMRDLDPSRVRSLPVAFADCPGMRDGMCPVEGLRAKVLGTLPIACADPQ